MEGREEGVENERSVQKQSRVVTKVEQIHAPEAEYL